MENHKKVIIIGSGFGGLTLACRLQARGYHVTLFEKNEMVGGHASQLKLKGYTFDMGPSIITAPELLEEIFMLAKRKLQDYVTLVPLNPFYRIYFHDKSFLDYSGDKKNMKQQLTKFNKKDGEGYERFLSYTKKLYEFIFVDGVGAKPFILKNFISFVPQALRLQAFRSVYTQTSSFFTDFRSRFAFSFHPLFIGGNPFTAPSVYLMIPYLEKKGGVFFSKGGMYSLVKAFEKLFIELGGEIRLNAPVDEILVDQKKAVGVMVRRKKYLADIIVSNAHFAHTYKELIPTAKRTVWTDKKILSKKYSMSCFLLYVGVKKKYPQLLHHTLLLSPRYKELIDDIFIHKIVPDDFSMYLHIPSRTDKTMAPAGSESMYVLVPVTNLEKRDIDWKTYKKIYTEKILHYLEYDFGMKDLHKHIEVCEMFTPDDFEKKRNNHLGACWSLEPSLLQSANFRPHNKSEEFENLFLVGASTHPGAGVPGVILSAKATDTAIKELYET